MLWIFLVRFSVIDNHHIRRVFVNALDVLRQVSCPSRPYMEI